ncbi:MAG: dihydrolipoamide acetyltransferase family protein [Hymenobacter sp.]
MMAVPYPPGPSSPVAPTKPGEVATMSPAAEAHRCCPAASTRRWCSASPARKPSAWADLERLPGTGQDSRVTKQDILGPRGGRQAHAGTHRRTGPAASRRSCPTSPGGWACPGPGPQRPAGLRRRRIRCNSRSPNRATRTRNPEPGTQEPEPKPSISGNQELMEMDRMRKMIAQRMVDSKRISPHVTSFVEADVTELVHWRNKNKDAYKKREGENLTFTPLFMQAVARAIQDFPGINVSVEGDYIIKKKDINVGVAVALPSGNLIVPVIHNADQLNLNGLSKKLNDLANRARQNKLTPADLEGGTYTLSNVGSFGNVMGTPIIMQPQVAIMAVGAIKKKPAVIETPQGDLIGVRHFMFLSHSYDHRVVDGSLGGMFVRRVADYLEQFDPNTTV